MICLSCWEKAPPLFAGDEPKTKDNWNVPAVASAEGTAADERAAILKWLHGNLGNKRDTAELDFMAQIMAIIANGIEAGEHLK